MEDKKKILLLYSYSNQRHLIDAIVEHSSCDDYNLSAIDVSDWSYTAGNNETPYIFKLLKNIRRNKLISFVGYKIFQQFLKREVMKYDAVDINAFMPTHYTTLDYLIKNGIPYKISFWGSDLYRASDAEMQKKKYYLDHAKIVQVETPIVKKDLLSKVSVNEDKIVIANYGINMLNTIDEVRKEPAFTSNPNDKIVITCGYNGAEGQQHKKMIEAIKAIEVNLKNQIKIYLPMTYGIQAEEYVIDIEKELQNAGVDYKILRKRLSEHELALLRLQTDIALNIQITDSFASSIIEHLYAGSIVLAGDWLPYDFFYEKGITYFKTSLEDITQNLNVIIPNIEKYKSECLNNKDNVFMLSSWNYLAKIHISNYQKLIE